MHSVRVDSSSEAPLFNPEDVPLPPMLLDTALTVQSLVRKIMEGAIFAFVGNQSYVMGFLQTKRDFAQQVAENAGALSILRIEPLQLVFVFPNGSGPLYRNCQFIIRRYVVDDTDPANVRVELQRESTGPYRELKVAQFPGLERLIDLHDRRKMP